MKRPCRGGRPNWFRAVAPLLGAGAMLAAGCSNTVVPPPAALDAVPAFLLDHGRHASLVVGHDRGMTRYSYGHWDYYVENRSGLLRGSGTLFSVSPAGVGRRQLSGPAELGAVRRQVRVPIEAAWRIDVPAARAGALVLRLDQLFTRHDGPALHNPLYDLDFVPHPAPYRTSHNSNHVTGEWLRALGCRVRMETPFSVWKVTAPATGAAAGNAEGAGPEPGPRPAGGP